MTDREEDKVKWEGPPLVIPMEEITKEINKEVIRKINEQ